MKGHSIRGKLGYVDIQVKDIRQINTNLFEKSIELANMEIVKKAEYSFGENYGSTIIYILEESHFSIHTYPEYNYFTVDIYTCGGEGSPEKAIKYILKQVDYVKYKTTVIKRGQLNI